MKKFLKRALPVISCIALFGLFSVFATEAWVNLKTIEEEFAKDQKWADTDYETIYDSDQNKTSYDKSTESYVLSIDTYGAIGPFIDTENNLVNNKINIDGDTTKTDDGEEENYDYQVIGDKWKITVPLQVAAIISHGKTVSPYITITNDGGLPTEVYIYSLVIEDSTEEGTFDSRGYYNGSLGSVVELVDDKEKISLLSTPDDASDDKYLYLGVKAPEDEDNYPSSSNAFSGLGEMNLKTVSSKSSEGEEEENHGIYLGRVPDYKIASEDDDKERTGSSSGTFLLDVMASKDFIVTYQGGDTYDYGVEGANYDEDYNSADGWTFNSYLKYTLCYKFILADSLIIEDSEDTGVSILEVTEE